MAELKTKQNDASVEAFLGAIADESRRDDCQAVAKIMKKATGEKPKMWGTSIVGFGSYRYKYASGQGGDWLMTGFSPRKQNLTLYIMNGVDKYPALMRKLGKHKVGKSCIYIQKLSDIDLQVLTELVEQSVKDLSHLRI